MKKLKYLAVGMALFLLEAPTVQAQKIQARAVIDSTNVLIGDQLNLRLEVDQPNNVILEFPEISDSLSSSVEVIEKSPLDTFQLDAENQIKIIQNLTITSFDSGRQVVPPFYFRLKYEELYDSIETLPAEFFVHSMPIDTTKGPVDIKRPYEAPVTLKEVSPYILGVILIGALLFFLFYYIQRRRQNKPIFVKPPKPKEPAHLIALRELDRIKEEKLWQSEEIKTYYSLVSDTLRTYIEDRFQIQAMEYTTVETVQAFEQQKNLISAKSLEELKSILNLSDLVKFAKYHPLPDDHNLTLMNAYFFVNQTKQEDKKTSQPQDDREGEEVDLK
ncbi:hypothetical protein [uncultured Sunxiuqinia sp.]|uniref:hypothetical protein n=1 Tax=uncultured Sunxiuqinia sp. TaxID=1573825 RepID=UPI00261053A7|nr:hypothetical protein [uncultured Sunxiuqinia sp.]